MDGLFRDLDRLIEFSGYLMDNMTLENNFESLLNIVGDLIAKYESENIEEPKGTPIGVLRLLMEQHGLKQKDLVEIGSPGVISEVLNGKRELNKRQIDGLAKRFNCSPAVFFLTIKRLAKIFRSEFGVNPKVYSRLRLSLKKPSLK